MKHSLSLALRVFGLSAISLVVFSSGASAAVIESYNEGFVQAPDLFWAPQSEIGWYYTPGASYSLTGIQTIFTQTNGAGDVDRDITIDVFTDRPGLGGTLLGSGTLDTSTARGTYGTADFSGISLVAGTTYFIGFENILGLGANQVTFADNAGAGPTGSVALGSTWTSTDDSFGTAASDGTTWFDKPEINFLTADAAVTPEPAPAILFLAIGLPGLGILRRIHRLR